MSKPKSAAVGETQVSAHTQGPWIVFHPDGRKHAEILDQSEAVLATIWRNDEANARLIAAAPEMLSAAQAIINTWMEYGFDEIDSSQLTELERAIAKAEGRA